MGLKRARSTCRALCWVFVSLGATAAFGSPAPAFAAAATAAEIGSAAAPGSTSVASAADSAATPLSLAQAVALAGGTAPAVTLATLRVGEAQGRVRQARSVYLPTLGGSAGFVRQTINEAAFGITLPVPPGQTPTLRIGPFNLWDTRAAIQQTLFSPSGWLQARAAARSESASEAERGTAQQGAAAGAGIAYVNASQAIATLAARKRELDLAQELLGIAQQQLKAGVAAQLDVIRAETQVASAQSGVELARSQATQSQIDLARALGLSPDRRFALTDTLGVSLASASLPQSRDEIVALALSRRPERQSARARQAAATVAARAVGAERIGNLSLSGNYGYDGSSPSTWITTGLVSAQYSIPLFEGGRLEGQRHELQAQAEEASVQLKDLENRITAEVEGAMEALRSGQARQTIAADQLRLAEEEEREARQLFSAGLAGNIELINAQADLVRAHSAVIDAQAQTAQARVRLAQAAGAVLTLR